MPPAPGVWWWWWWAAGQHAGEVGAPPPAATPRRRLGHGRCWSVAPWQLIACLPAAGRDCYERPAAAREEVVERRLRPAAAANDDCDSRRAITTINIKAIIPCMCAAHCPLPFAVPSSPLAASATASTPRWWPGPRPFKAGSQQAMRQWCSCPRCACMRSTWLPHCAPPHASRPCEGQAL